MIDNKYALLFIRGERPIIDLNYDVLKHPNVSMTSIGGRKAYVHGNSDLAIATISVNYSIKNFSNDQTNSDRENRFDIVSSEIIEEYLRRNDNNEQK